MFFGLLVAVVRTLDSLTDSLTVALVLTIVNTKLNTYDRLLEKLDGMYEIMLSYNAHFPQLRNTAGLSRIAVRDMIGVRIAVRDISRYMYPNI